MLPEPEPYEDCNEFYIIDPLSYFIMFFGAGMGWFAVGYLMTGEIWKRTRDAPAPILAQLAQ